MKSIREWILENSDEAAMKRIMGNSVAIDPTLKGRLRPKIEQIIKEEESEDPIELFRQILAISASLIGDLRGTRVSAHQVLDALHSEEGE
jgi:hypothetical protein